MGNSGNGLAWHGFDETATFYFLNFLTIVNHLLNKQTWILFTLLRWWCFASALSRSKAGWVCNVRRLVRTSVSEIFFVYGITWTWRYWQLFFGFESMHITPRICIWGEAFPHCEIHKVFSIHLWKNTLIGCLSSDMTISLEFDAESWRWWLRRSRVGSKLV